MRMCAFVAREFGDVGGGCGSAGGPILQKQSELDSASLDNSTNSALFEMINKMNSKLECQQDVILEACALMKHQSAELCSIKSPLGRVDVDMKNLEISKPQGSPRSVARSHSKTYMSLGRVDVDMKKLEITKPQGSPRSVARSSSKTDIDYRAYMAQLEACEEYEPNVSTPQAQMAGAMYQSLDFHQKRMQTARLLGNAEEEDKARLKVQQCKQRLEMRPGLLIGASDGVYVSEAGSSAVSRVESAGARVNSLPPSNKIAFARVSSLPPSKEIAFARVSSLPSSKEIAFANQIRAGINSNRTAK